MTEFDKAVEFFLNELGLDLLVQYNQNNLRASGNFEGLMQVQKNKLILAAYALYITEGNTRGPGKSPPVFDIFKWLFDKGITPRDKQTGRFMSYEAAAYLIARGIAREGTKFQYSQPIDFDQAKLKAYKKTMPKFQTAIVNDVFKAAKWTAPNQIIVEL